MFLPVFNSNSNGQQQVVAPEHSMYAVFLGALLIVLLIFVLGIFYKRALKRSETYDKIPKFFFIIFLLIRWVKMNTIKLLGNKNKFAIPFFIYIIFYFWASGITNILGLTGILNFMIVPISLSGVVLLGTMFFSARAKGLGLFRDYFIWVKRKGRKIFPIPDILSIIGELGKMASLAFRLWGNFFAGTMFIYIFGVVVKPALSSLGLSGSLAAATIGLPLTLYFDVVDTILHSMIFLFLTLTYWSLAIHSVENQKKVN